MQKLKISYEFINPKLCELALTHKSVARAENNERLEFLGDAVLDLAVTDFIYENYPELPEGTLAKIRAEIVCSASLAEVAEKLKIGSAIDLGKGEVIKPSILTDTMEAVIAAVYLDGGFEVVKTLILNWFSARIEQAVLSPGMEDYKSRLQELSAKLFNEAPSYEFVDEGPAHDKFFYARVEIIGKEWGKGEGHTKKEATQIAAKKAFAALEKESTNER